jgi:hypothetical protein
VVEKLEDNVVSYGWGNGVGRVGFVGTVGAEVAEGVSLLMKGNELVSDSIASCRGILGGLCLSCSDQSVKLDHDFHPRVDAGEKASNTIG